MTERKLKYVAIVPVWGAHHTGLFLRFCIPFLLTEGNVGAFPNRTLQVVVLSTRADFANMHHSANYLSLKERTNITEVEIDQAIDLSTPHRAMTQCYLRAICDLQDPDNTVTIFPTPDCILSRNTLFTVVSHMEAGWRAVMVCGLRANLETAAPELDAVVSKIGGPQELDEQSLTAFTLKNLHQISADCDISSDRFMVGWPSHVYWTAQDRSWLVAHCFHLHPLAIRGRPEHIDINTTIDGDYLADMGVASEDLYVCQDSLELACIEFSSRQKQLVVKRGRFSRRALARFYLSNCNTLHRKFFARAIFWRSKVNGEVPVSVEVEAAKLQEFLEDKASWVPLIEPLKKNRLFQDILKALVEPVEIWPAIKRRSKRLLMRLAKP